MPNDVFPALGLKLVLLRSFDKIISKLTKSKLFNTTIKKKSQPLSNQNPRWVSQKKWGAEKLYYFSHFLFIKGLKRMAYLTKYINTLVFRNFIPPEAKICKRLDLPHGGFGFVMHEDTSIGDDAIIFHNVTIANGGTRIGDRVYIGTGSVILGAVQIGNDVVIGANSFVNFDIPDGATVVGQPAKIIKLSLA
ncbi:MAG: DapH/DapD/GlmU-related protein [Desulfobacula sp.]|jgi:serine O-acetyltransferase